MGGPAPESGERQNGGQGIFESRQPLATGGTGAGEGRNEKWEGEWKSSEGSHQCMTDNVVSASARRLQPSASSLCFPGHAM